ncbi:MAG: hypothetical protein HW390_3155 [Candidatus Brocadiaceae bacterium]|nr:hypothetical protein [Candidatus Brocadiaceae bacterium]
MSALDGKLLLMATEAIQSECEVNVLADACVVLPLECVTITMPKKKKKIPDKLQAWIDARKTYHLSHAQVQMARDLGMNPKGFRKLANHKQEKWKLPLPLFIEECYSKRFRQNSTGASHAHRTSRQSRQPQERRKETEARTKTCA